MGFLQGLVLVLFGGLALLGLLALIATTVG
jgi:hypothetical protein